MDSNSSSMSICSDKKDGLPLTFFVRQNIPVNARKEDLSYLDDLEMDDDCNGSYTEDVEEQSSAANARSHQKFTGFGRVS